MDEYIDHLIKLYKNGNKYLDWDHIKPISHEDITEYGSFDSSLAEETIGKLSKKVCMLKLSGGLGTTMGCSGAKGLIGVKNGLSFLDITVNQLKYLNSRNNCNIPLLLMTSFYTDNEIKEYVQDIKNIRIETFEQTVFPRLAKDGSKLINCSEKINDENIDHWYPPGHGDMCISLNKTGMLDRLIKEGYEYIFVSNIDNLGATLDFSILNELVDKNIDFAVELTNKTVNDIKGGTLIKYNDRNTMFEIAQCNPDKIDEFVKFKYFNTNNIWIKLESIKKLLATDYLNHIDIIVNCKKTKKNIDCVQLEYGLGSLVKFFDKTENIIVPRNRFIPVKSNSDLLLVKSTNYDIDKDNWNFVNKIKNNPVIKLDPIYNNSMTFNECFTNIPNIENLQELQITGKIKMGRNVVLRNSVKLVNDDHDFVKIIEDNSIFE